jgi:hypothetical protein
VYVKELKAGTISDEYGYYVLNIPKGQYNLAAKFLGMKDKSFKIILNDDGQLNILLAEKIIKLKDVVVTAEKERNVKSLETGLNKIDLETVARIPTSVGEVDLIKSTLLLPGVQTVGEGASGFNVRGGSTDQNLILIDDSPLFNSSHLFGFFSAFNPYIVNDFKLYKGAIPAKYGGRISSVFDVSVKHGNLKEFSGSGGISPITTKLAFDGPIIKNKASFVVAARSTYFDWLLKHINKPIIQNSDASFYDANAKIHYKLNNNDALTVSGYHSNDYFKLNADTAYNYGNTNASVKWKHPFTKQFYGTFSGVYSRYKNSISSETDPYQAFELDHSIDYKEIKANFSYYPNSKHDVDFGAGIIHYDINPSAIKSIGNESIIKARNLENEQAYEPSLYISDEYKVNERLSINAGLRLSSFLVTGPKTVYEYNPNAPRNDNSRLDSMTYGNNEIIKTYRGPGFRLSARYKLGYTNSIKMSYNRIYQYLHMLSNSSARSPTDIWKISDSHLPPQRGDQLALGYYQNLENNTIETSVEVYYKNLHNIIEYKGGTEFLLNETIETDLIAGQGKAYGAELFINKKYGKLNGWLGYTYSRTLVKVNSEYKEETINNGDYFPADYDKPHDFTVVMNYKFSRRVNMSTNITYSTGRPVTVPAGKFYFKNRELSLFTQRNEYRIPDYFRWDLSINLERSLRTDKLMYSYWSFSVYNLTGRKNVYSVFFKTNDKGKIQGYKLSVFAQPIFSVSYNFKF